ncbi:MAG: hypothetical protein GX609_06620 [Actinomycetales bacterium]|jgi:hypothetical protein|nr:hypothetical protein [Actinomycetales bacterium]
MPRATSRVVVNAERPATVPVKPMGSVPVIVHVVWSDGAEEWRPARAIRWTSTHVMVGWPEGDGRAERHDERWEWLRAQDVMRSVRWLVPPQRA